MELRHLRYFVAAAEEENISRAALRLHVSQPALSRQIRDLENELGFLLLERTAKSVRLTAAGKFFLKEARGVIERARDAIDRTRVVAEGEQGEIHVGYAPSLTVEILPRALRAFQSDFPKVKVRLHDLSTEEMLDQLREGKLNVALLVKPPRPMLRGLRFRDLERYPVCAVVAPQHRLARLRSVPVAALAGEPFIGYSLTDYPEYHDYLGTIFAAAKLRPRVIEEHDGVASLTAAVEAGRGIAVAPSCLQAMVGSRLKLIPLRPPGELTVVGAAWKKDALAPMAANFLAAAGLTAPV